MATIRQRTKKNGETSFEVMIRTKGSELFKTFKTFEDAKLFMFFREQLTKNMDAFQVDIKDRVTLKDVIELKIKAGCDLRTHQEYENTQRRALENLKEHFFLSELTFNDWFDCLKRISCLMIPERSKSKKLVRISLVSVRRIFACLSAAFNSAILKGINIENFPLQIVQKHINPSLKKKSD